MQLFLKLYLTDGTVVPAAWSWIGSAIRFGTSKKVGTRSREMGNEVRVTKRRVTEEPYERKSLTYGFGEQRLS